VVKGPSLPSLVENKEVRRTAGLFVSLCLLNTQTLRRRNCVEKCARIEHAKFPAFSNLRRAGTTLGITR